MRGFLLIFLLVSIRDAKTSPKAKPEPRPAPQEIWWAQHQARPASFKHRMKPGSQFVIDCNQFSQARHEPGGRRLGSAKSPSGPEFSTRPGCWA